MGRAPIAHDSGTRRNLARYRNRTVRGHPALERDKLDGCAVRKPASTGSFRAGTSIAPNG
jgi:hypothetical protein